MKVNAAGPARTTPARRAAKSTTGGSFRLQGTDEDEAAVQQAAPVHAPVGIDALLSLQEVPDARSGRSKGLRHGLDLLDQLDQLRLGLLAGSLAPKHLRQLLAALQGRRPATGDPRLEAILDEIELRAAVEIAKLEMAQRP